MLKVTKCIGVKSFVEALINMVCELKITSGCKKMCKNFMVIRHSIKELLAKSMVTRPMKCIVGNRKPRYIKERLDNTFDQTSHKISTECKIILYLYMHVIIFKNNWISQCVLSLIHSLIHLFPVYYFLLL